MVSGYDIKFISGGNRRGRLIIPNPVNMRALVNVRNAGERCLGVRGAQNFNLMPESITTINTAMWNTLRITNMFSLLLFLTSQP